MPLTQTDAQRDAQARLTYEPMMSSLASVFMASVFMSGKAGAGDTQNMPANKNYSQGAHNKSDSDAWLKRTAEDLRTVGAPDMFRQTHPFECLLIEHMDAMLAAL